MTPPGELRGAGYLTKKHSVPEAASIIETWPGGTQLHLMGIKTPSSLSVAPPPAPEPVLGPLLPSSAPSGLQPRVRQSHPKRRIAFYSHRAAPFLVPKLPAIQSGKRGVEMGRGRCLLGCGGVPRLDAGKQPAFPPSPGSPHTALSSGSSGRPPSRPRPLEGAPVPLLPPAGFAARTLGTAEVDLLVHALW